MIAPNVLTTALTGLNANAQRVNRAAHNIANISTPGFKAEDVQTVSQARPQGGATGYTPAGVQGLLTIGDSGTDLATEIIHLINAETAYKASAKLITTADEMSKSLLDITG